MGVGKAKTKSRNRESHPCRYDGTADSDRCRDRSPYALDFGPGSKVGQRTQSEQTREDPQPQRVEVPADIDHSSAVEEEKSNRRVEEHGYEPACDAQAAWENTGMHASPCRGTAGSTQCQGELKNVDNDDEGYGDPCSGRHGLGT